MNLTGLRSRLDRLEVGDDELMVVWVCERCHREVLHYTYGEPCESHELAPPTRPGERVIVVEHVHEPDG